jgi:transposase-like protein
MNHKQIMDDIIDAEYMNKTQFSKQFDEAVGQKDKLKVINLLVEKYKCDFDTAKLICDFVIDGTPLPSDLSPAEIAHNNAVAQEWQNKPKCPTCGSTNISKIGTLNRMASVGFFGLASSKIGKTQKCNNCGYTW